MEAAKQSKLVMRYEFRSYMDTSEPPHSEAVWSLIGEGFTSLTESKNPTEYSRKYVHEKTERTDVVGFATQIEYTTDTYTENPVINKIREVTDNELTGTDTQVDILNVNMYEDAGEADAHKYTAYKRTYAIIPNQKGEGTDALIYSGSFRAAGDVTPGTFDGKKFTPASENP